MSADACGTARIGCSGWSYADWRGVVYPTRIPKRDWFGFYASMFDTVELNSTFYRLPTEQTVETWAAAAPAGFVYALKLGAFGMANDQETLELVEDTLRGALSAMRLAVKDSQPDMVSVLRRFDVQRTNDAVRISGTIPGDAQRKLMTKHRAAK
jgi:hypothetical protein